MAIGTPDWWSRTRALLDMDFTDLRDTPGTYGAEAGKAVIVVITEDGMVFSETIIDNHSARHESGGADELDLSDLPGSYTNADAQAVIDAMITDFTETLLADADADTFLATLGLSVFVRSLMNDADADTFLATLGLSVFVRSLMDNDDANAFLTAFGVDMDLLTFSLPADTTITDYIKTLLDDGDSATARATLEIPIDPAVDVGGMRTLGTGALQAAPGDDARLSDQRVPIIGSVTQPKLSYAAGNNLIVSSDKESTDGSGNWTRVKEIRVVRTGTLRIRHDHRTSTNGAPGSYSRSRIHRNGVAVGIERIYRSTTYTTFSEDIAGWSPGNLCQLYIRSYGGETVYVRNFRIHVDNFQYELATYTK